MEWTDEKFQALKGLTEQNLSARQIGIELGVSRNAVIGKVHRGGLHLKNPPSKPLVPPRRRPQMSKPRMPKPPSSTALPPEPPQEEIAGPVVSFAELTAHHCRWPVGDAYCGGTVVAGSSYCRRHTVLAHHHRVPA
jgi:GcrA cell cycle regulator